MRQQYPTALTSIYFIVPNAQSSFGKINRSALAKTYVRLPTVANLCGALYLERHCMLDRIHCMDTEFKGKRISLIIELNVGGICYYILVENLCYNYCYLC